MAARTHFEFGGGEHAVYINARRSGLFAAQADTLTVERTLEFDQRGNG
jgi:hypothetical protein